MPNSTMQRELQLSELLRIVRTLEALILPLQTLLMMEQRGDLAERVTDFLATLESISEQMTAASEKLTALVPSMERLSNLERNQRAAGDAIMNVDEKVSVLMSWLGARPEAAAPT